MRVFAYACVHACVYACACACACACVCVCVYIKCLCMCMRVRLHLCCYSHCPTRMCMCLRLHQVPVHVYACASAFVYRLTLSNTSVRVFASALVRVFVSAFVYACVCVCICVCVRVCTCMGASALAWKRASSQPCPHHDLSNTCNIRRLHSRFLTQNSQSSVQQLPFASYTKTHRALAALIFFHALQTSLYWSSGPGAAGSIVETSSSPCTLCKSSAILRMLPSACLKRFLYSCFVTVGTAVLCTSN